MGGLLFVASLLFFAASLAWRFDDGPPWSGAAAGPPLVIDVMLFSVFALHHSITARAGLKAWIARFGIADLERSVYVWIASVLFALVCAFWQPVPGVLWRMSGAAAAALRAAQLAGVVLTIVAARRLDVLELAGIRPRRSFYENRKTTSEVVLDTGPYGLVRHPIYLGWVLMVWLPPVMNGTRLVFAAVSCLYLLVAIPFEERDLRRTFGEAYGQYMTKVRWKVLPGVY